MYKCPSCGHRSDGEWNYCVRCGSPRSVGRAPVEYKLVVMGSGGVGKSALSIRFIHGNFVSSYDPTIEDRYTKHLEFEGGEVKIDLLDTAGQETFSAMRELYVANGDGFIFVYSITQEWSFANLKDFYTSLQRRRVNNIPPLILVGNKCDLNTARRVSIKELADLSKEWSSDFIEASAKTGENVGEIFMILLKRLKENNPVVTRRRACITL